MGATLRTTRIIWGAMMWACVIYAGIAWMARPADAVPTPMMLPALAIASVVVAVMSFVLPRMTYASAARAMGDKVAVIDRSAMPVDAAHFRSGGVSGPVFADTPAAEGEARRMYVTTLIVGMALSESVALFGFVLGFTGFSPVTFMPFIVAGVVLIAIRFPTRDAVLKPFEKAFGARFESAPPG